MDDRQSTGLLTGMDAVAESFDAPPNDGSGSIVHVEGRLSQFQYSPPSAADKVRASRNEFCEMVGWSHVRNICASGFDGNLTLDRRRLPAPPPQAL